MPLMVSLSNHERPFDPSTSLRTGGLRANGYEYEALAIVTLIYDTKH